METTSGCYLTIGIAGRDTTVDPHRVLLLNSLISMDVYQEFVELGFSDYYKPMLLDTLQQLNTMNWDG